MYNKDLVFIIPAYNESKTILKVINSALEFGDVTVINDCSTDNTEEIISTTNAFLINNPTNMGYEISLSLGIRSALNRNYSFLITLDGDGQLSPSKTPEILNLLKLNDAVIGNRNLKPRIAEKLSGKITNLIFGFQDPFCGLKAYSLKSLKNTEKLHYNTSIGTELIIRMAKGRKKIKQIDIAVVDRIGSQSTFGKNSLILNIKFLFFFIRTMILSPRI